jgi:hypothetical protein
MARVGGGLLDDDTVRCGMLMCAIEKTENIIAWIF